jgi:hypothetical protein
MQTDGRVEASKWPIGLEEENMSLGKHKKNKTSIHKTYFVQNSDLSSYKETNASIV